MNRGVTSQCLRRTSRELLAVFVTNANLDLNSRRDLFCGDDTFPKLVYCSQTADRPPGVLETLLAAAGTSEAFFTTANRMTTLMSTCGWEACGWESSNASGPILHAMSHRQDPTFTVGMDQLVEKRSMAGASIGHVWMGRVGMIADGGLFRSIHPPASIQRRRPRSF